MEQVDLVAMLEARFAELSGDQEGSLKLELNGVLYWNGAAGHAALLELSGSVRVELGLRDPILGSYPADGSFRARYAGDVALRIAVR